MTFIGIDCGLQGAVAVISNDSSIQIFPTPVMEVDKRKVYNFQEINSLLTNILRTNGTPFLCTVEKQWGRPIQGVQQAFYTGMGYATWQMALASNLIPYQTVSPAAWKKYFKIDSNDKNKAIMLCQERFPHVNLKRTERCKKACTDFADALLLATYGKENA